MDGDSQLPFSNTNQTDRSLPYAYLGKWLQVLDAEYRLISVTLNQCKTETFSGSTWCLQQGSSEDFSPTFTLKRENQAGRHTVKTQNDLRPQTPREEKEFVSFSSEQLRLPAARAKNQENPLSPANVLM